MNAHASHVIKVTERAHTDACYAAWEAKLDAMLEPTDDSLKARLRERIAASKAAGRIADEVATAAARNRLCA